MEENKIKFWNIKTKEDKTTIDLFGYVGGSKAWGEGFNEDDFLNEIRAIPQDNELEISINSTGGSVFTALSIYALLTAHKGAITFRVNGVAMSAATIITSVPNAKVVMPKGSLLMIHKVSAGAYGNIDDMRKMADDLEKIEQNILNIYATKTGKSVEEIAEAVNAETYFTAEEAVAFGLADEVDEGVEVKNEAINGVYMCNGLEVAPEFLKNAPANIFGAGAMPPDENNIPTKKEKKEMDIETLKAEYPELVEAIRNEAITAGAEAERARIKAIEEIATPGHEALVNEAKFVNAMSAEALAVAILKADKARNANELAKRVKDASGLDAIATTGNEGLLPNAEEKQKKEAELKAFVEAGAKAFARK